MVAALAGSEAVAENAELATHVVLFMASFLGRGFNSRRLHHSDLRPCPSEHGIDACLVLLLSQPREKVRIQTDRNRLLRRWKNDARLFPELHIGWPRLRVVFDGVSNSTIAQRTETLPIGAFFSQPFARRFSFMSLRLPRPIYIMSAACLRK